MPQGSKPIGMSMSYAVRPRLAAKRRKKFSELDEGTDASWAAKHQQVRITMGLQDEVVGSTRLEYIKCLAEQSTRKEGKEVENLFSDISQSANRRPWTVG
eukprot:4893968-Amphidinium_carterae.2